MNNPKKKTPESNKSQILYSAIVFLITAITAQSFLLNAKFNISNINPDCPWCLNSNQQDELIYLPINTDTLRFLLPADVNFISDLLWLRTTYYFGVHALTDNQYFYLHYLLDLITDLAPRWDYPYIFGAVILPIETDAADDALYLIEKGLRYNPDLWNLLFFKGFILWHYKRNFVGAATSFFEASLIKGSPKYLASLSLTLASKAGQKELAKKFAKTALKYFEDPLQKQILQNKLDELQHNE